MSSVSGVTPSKEFDRQLRRRHKSANFRLTSKTLGFLRPLQKKVQFTSKTKKLCSVVSGPFSAGLLVPKQDSTAEQQLTQQKTELDARDKALDEREKALEQREKLVAKPRVPSVAQYGSGSRRASADSSS
jgi:hypothetical protein